MFRDVPECSGMFHVPGFIDDLRRLNLLCLKKRRKKIKYWWFSLEVKALPLLALNRDDFRGKYLHGCHELATQYCQ